MKHKSFFKNVAVISIGGFLARGIGALYRVPLVGALGGYGMGLYQMAYPFFCLMLTFSSAGVPAALSRMVAREEGRGGGRQTALAALKLFFLLGLTGSVVMAVFAPLVGKMQKEAALAACYRALSPSVFLVALVSVLRGYFQGKSNMAPTAVSEIAEQVIKAAAGTLFAYRLAADPVRAAEAALFAVTLSEGAALVYLLARWRREERSRMLPVRPATGYDVFRAALPVMVSASLLPLSQTVDSVLVVRLLARHTPRAVALYGLLSGGAAALIRLPAALCCGIAAAAVPSVSRAASEEEARERSLRAISLALLLSVPCALGLFFFAEPIVRLLYGGLSAEDAAVLVRLVRILSFSAVSLSATDVLAACLTGMGRAGHAALSMLAAVTVKLFVQLLLVPDPAFSVEGAALAADLCYLVAFFLDLFYTIRKKRGKAYDHGRESRNGAGGSDPAGEGGALLRGQGAGAHRGNSLGANA